MPHVERPAFKIYRFKKGAWPEMILHAVMGAGRHIEYTSPSRAPEEWERIEPQVPNGHDPAGETHEAGHMHNGVRPSAFGAYSGAAHAELGNGAREMPHLNGHGLGAAQEPQPVEDEAAQGGIDAKRIVGWFGHKKGA
jgi:hypothetical protein